MFTWICPQCGREVPPAYTECPDCSGETARAQAAAAARAAERAAEPEPAPPMVETPSVAPPASPAQAPRMNVQPQASYAPPRQPAARAARGSGMALPTWLMAVLFALAFMGVVFGVYWLVGAARSAGKSTAGAAVETPASQPAAAASPLQRYVEVSGLRYVEDPKHKDQTLVKIAITNHSEADLKDLAGSVQLLGVTRTAQQEPEGTFHFTTNIAPNETKEITAPLTTRKKIYELPDWQNAVMKLEITAPGGSSPGSPSQQ